MHGHKRRLSKTRETRDPAVATAYTSAQTASAEWTLALAAALRGQPVSFPPLQPAEEAPRQLALPLAEPATAA